MKDINDEGSNCPSQQATIYDGLVINNDFWIFEPRKDLYDNLFEIYLPRDFTIMPKGVQIVKYSNTAIPDICFMNFDGTINLNFTMLKLQMNQENIGKNLKDIVRVITRIDKSVSIKAEVVEPITSGTEELLSGSISYTSKGLDEDIFNLTYYIQLRPESLLMINFNLAERRSEGWLPAFQQIVKSIKLDKSDFIRGI